MNNLVIGFGIGVVVMFCFEYPALNTALAGLSDKNAQIQILQHMCDKPGVEK